MKWPPEESSVRSLPVLLGNTQFPDGRCKKRKRNRKVVVDGDFPLLEATHDVGTIFVVHQGLVVGLPLRAHLLDPISLDALVFPLIMADDHI